MQFPYYVQSGLVMSVFFNSAVIGLGVGEQHAQALLTHPATRLTAVCDHDPQKIACFVNKHSLPLSIEKSFSEILQDESIRLVTIASFDNDHFEQVIACLQHGKHVFVEKPLCQNRAQLKEIYELWCKQGVGLASNLVLRKAPLYRWLENIISCGELGEIYALDMDYLYGRMHKITEGWRSQMMDYSVMAGGGIHLVDLMMRFMGQKPVRVQSCVNKIATRDTAFQYHDFHAATFYFANNAIGRVTANFGCVHRHQHAVRIFGTKATFIYDDMGARIHWHREENPPMCIDLAPKPMNKGELLLDFVDDVLFDSQLSHGQTEFDLICAIAAADAAISPINNVGIDIDYNLL